MRKRVRLASKTYIIMSEDDLIPNVSRTCEALAVAEAHCLHALGEHDLVDST